MNRRAFLTRLLAGAAAPLIAKPTWEEIERLTWKRRFFPGYSPHELLPADLMAQRALEMLEYNLRFAKLVHRDYQAEFQAQCRRAPRIGESIHVRKPQRFVRG